MSFIEEFRKLFFASPKPQTRSLVLAENCEYTYYVSESKNLYYTFDFVWSEDCYYCDWGLKNKNCVDCSHIQFCELCYECLDSTHCYNSDFLWECHGSRDSKFCFDCRDCEYCFLSSGLRKKAFYIENKPYSKEAYFEKVREILKTSSRETLQKKFLEMAEKAPRISSHSMKAENVFGDFIYESKNCYGCFDIVYAEDCFYMYDSGAAKNSCDMLLSSGDLNYEMVQCEDKCYNCNFCLDCTTCRDSEFLSYCFHCQNCFGCVTLQRKEFHILNKPYSKEEYFHQVREIKNQLKERRIYSLDIFRL